MEAKFETGFSAEECQAQWIIENFEFGLKNNLSFQEQRITLKLKESTWNLNLAPDSKAMTQFRIGCQLTEKLSTKAPNVSAKFYFEIKYSDGKIFSKIDFGPNLFTVAQSLFTAYIDLSGKTEPLPLFNGSLVINVRLLTYSDEHSESLATATGHFEGCSIKTLGDDIASLVLGDDDHLKDVQLVMIDEEVIGAHRNTILSARSPVFRTMFRTPLKEEETRKVEISDISGISMKALLHFMYSGQLPKNWTDPDVVTGFVYAAHKYQVADLVKFLDGNLDQACTEETAGELLQLSHTLGLESAEGKLKEFIKMKSGCLKISSLPGLVHLGEVMKDEKLRTKLGNGNGEN